MPDFLNPGRRYKYFRPRQAAIVGNTTIGSANKPTLSLFNNSPGTHVLVIRELLISAQGTVDLLLLGYNQGRLGSIHDNPLPLIGGEARPPGELDFLDTATTITAIFALSGLLFYQLPQWGSIVAVLQPGWAFAIQDQTVARSVFATFYYEFIEADQLDYAY